MAMRLILASASPRRRELLARLGLPFEVVPSEISEEISGPVEPERIVRELAREKADDVWRRDPEGTLVLGADTIVVTDQPGLPTILGKPTDAGEARRMLGLLSGTTHTVYTGMALMRTTSESEALEIGEAITEVVDTQVTFRKLTPAMIDAYVATGEPFDKAGAYGIQGYASVFVEAVHGDYYNVVGLPLQTVGRLLERAGIEWWRGKDALECASS